MKTSSMSPPRGSQVDGLPRVRSVLDKIKMVLDMARRAGKRGIALLGNNSIGCWG